MSSDKSTNKSESSQSPNNDEDLIEEFGKAEFEDDEDDEDDENDKDRNSHWLNLFTII
jgi:hypothetical protein